jgi:hypothetical protein
MPTKSSQWAGRGWLTPVIPATQKEHGGPSSPVSTKPWVQPQPHKGLTWLRVELKGTVDMEPAPGPGFPDQQWGFTTIHQLLPFCHICFLFSFSVHIFPFITNVTIVPQFQRRIGPRCPCKWLQTLLARVLTCLLWSGIAFAYHLHTSSYIQVYFGSTGVWTQGLTLAMQALEPGPQPLFALVILDRVSSFCPGLASDLDPLTYCLPCS